MFIGTNISLTGVRGGSTASQGTLWTPAEISTTVWGDANDLTTLFQDTAGTVPATTAGETVARIDFKSGNGHHGLQDTTAARPTLRQEATGEYSLEFDGDDDFLRTPTAINPGSNKAQVFSVAMFGGTNSFQVLFNLGSLGSNDPLLLEHADQQYNIYSNSSIYDPSLSSPASYPRPAKNLLTALIDRPATGADALAYRIDGAPVVSTINHKSSASNFGSYRLGLGAEVTDAGSLAFMEGRLYEIIVCFGPPLDAITIEKIEGYLAHKWGLTANLPADHPYKTDAPVVTL